MTDLARKMNRLVTLVKRGLLTTSTGRMDRTFTPLPSGNIWASYESGGASYTNKQDLMGQTAVFTIRQDLNLPSHWESNKYYLKLWDRDVQFRIFKILKFEDYHGEYFKLFCEEEEKESTL